MKTKITLFLVFSIFLFSCNKEFIDNDLIDNGITESQKTEIDSIPFTLSPEVLADSLAKMLVTVNEMGEEAIKNKRKSGAIYTDWSGKITFKVFSVTSSLNNHNDGLVAHVDPDYVCVGGSGCTSDVNYGAYLTETRPLLDFSGWVASSKDHVFADPHRLTTYAIGIKIEGVSRSTLISYLKIKTVTSSTSSSPYAEVTASSGYWIIGGGAKITYNGYGILLTTCRPHWGKWIVSGKAHYKSDTGKITSYLIELKQDIIPGFGSLNVQIEEDPWDDYSEWASKGTGLKTSVREITPGISGASGMTCPGLQSIYEGYGRLLIGAQINSPVEIVIRTKDHYKSDIGYATGDIIHISKHK